MPNLQTALRLATSDKEFAEALLKNPDSFKHAFNLNDKQVAGLKKAASAGVSVNSLMASDYVKS